MSRPASRSVWDAINAAKLRLAVAETERDLELLAQRDDDLGDELADRADGPEPPEAA